MIWKLAFGRRDCRLPWARVVLGIAFAATLAGGVQAADLNWQVFEGHRRAALTVARGGRTGFTDVATIAGITFTNRLSDERSLTNQILLNGSGVAAGDIDGDGLCDLYFCGLDSPNALFRNLGGWRFRDVTADAGVACADQASTGATFADVEGDRDLDLLVTGVFRGPRLFLNDGRGRFRETTDESGLRRTNGSVTMALADIDGDGLLDLYVVNYRNDTMRDLPGIRFEVGVTNGVYHLLTVNGRAATAPDLAGRFSFDRSGGVLENGEADVLFRNQGQGRFAALSWTEGAFLDENGAAIRTPYDWGLTAMFRDLNGDRAPDLYVCNDFQSPDRIWINDGLGRFRAINRTAIRQTSLFSMGIDFADLDRDGQDDFFVADMLSRDHARRQVQVMDRMAFAQFRNTADDRPQFSRNMLFHNRGNGTYAEVAQFAGLDASDWSWCPAFLDVDLDGYEDLLITTGHWRDAQHADIARELDEAGMRKRMPPLEQLRARRRFPRLDTANFAFHNRRNLTFQEVGAAWGFDSRRVSQGMALADLDNDGDLDAAINCLNDAPLICRNDSPNPRVAVRLRGRAPNTYGVGAKISVRAPGLPAQSQEFICGGRYLSSDEIQRTFAAGSTTNRVNIEVTWRSGTQSKIEGAPANHVYLVEEPGEDNLKSKTSNPKSETRQLSTLNSQPFFEDASHLLGHQHVDEPFDDFARQPLLPRKLSQLGPGVTWLDFNGDGWDDLIVGTGRGGRIAVFRNDGRGQFVRQRAKFLEAPADRDLTTVLGWQPNPTNLVLLVGLANYEDGSTNAPSLRQFSVVNGASDDNLLRSAASTGPLALADLDRDGDLDLFVGGRVIAGRYPEPASSVLLRNDRGLLKLDPAISRPFSNMGLVSSALFTDLDADGWPELVLACDWGPLRVLRNNRGTFMPWNARLRWTSQTSLNAPASTALDTQRFSTLNSLTGWWNSIAAGDLDGDGRQDLVAGNWGRNTSRQRFLTDPIRLYFGETGGSRDLALIEARRDPGLGKWVPARDWAALSGVFPMLRERFSSFTAFSAASMRDALDAGLPPMREAAAATLDSILLLNRGEYFEASPLPDEAQLSPVFGIAVGDLDGDGHEDLFLAQNFFGVAPSESRQDAGCGLWLRGSRGGHLVAVRANESGFAVFGEARGAALCDFDHDGRLDLAIGQNSGPTVLLRNAQARPGLRVRLHGSAENPQAVGAVLRVVFRGGDLGPAREIRLGEGYGSQHSTEVVLGLPEEPEALEILWPDQTKETVNVPAEVRHISHRKSSGYAFPQ
ncbi:MAG: VCBS repeat-containing protein [Verrucomicrobia bacterium]|nr:VCBS repeat-containing protein [Verrucomicrobiota bacterium]